MKANGKYIGVLLIVLVVVVVGSYSLISPNTERNQDTFPDRDVYINYVGNVHSENGVTLQGEINAVIVGVEVAPFSDVGLYLFDENGSLLSGECLGELSDDEPVSVDQTWDVPAKYIVIHSPEFWTVDTSTPVMVDYFERAEDEYIERAVSRPSSYPTNVSQHDPCDG